MGPIIEVFFSGLTQGAVYCVFALGLAIVYGTARVLNFAHGSFYTLSAYLGWLLTAGYFGLGYPLAILILLPGLFALGVVFERLVIRPVRWSTNWQTTTMMVTLGLAFVIDNFNLIAFGPGSKVLPPFINGQVAAFGAVFAWHKLLIFVAAISIVILLELFLQRTRHGQAMQAVSQDMQGAGMVGIDVNRVFAYAFGLSVMLAGIAGMLLAPITLISPLGGWTLFLKAFVVVVFGGLGSTRGTLYAAFILGLIEAFVIYWLGASWVMPVWLLTLLVVLMTRPQGLMGRWGN